MRTWPPWGRRTSNQSYGKNLSLVLSDELDKQAINGDGSAPNLAGVFQGLTDPTDPTAVADFDSFAAAHADGVDGLWANTIKGREHCLWSYHVQARKPHIPDRHEL